MSGKEYDTIATRLAQIITRLNEGTCLDLEELREDFNGSLDNTVGKFTLLVCLVNGMQIVDLNSSYALSE
jgi:hypothetical protein